MHFSSHCIDASLLSSTPASPVYPFLESYSLSMSFLVGKALSIDINFLIFWSICWSSVLVCFKNGQENLARVTSQAFIPFMRFLLQSYKSSRSAEKHFDYFFFHLSFFDGVSICKFSFLWALWVFFDLVVLFLPSFVFFHFPLLGSPIPSQSLVCIFLSFVLVSIFFLNLGNSVMSSINFGTKTFIAI